MKKYTRYIAVLLASAIGFLSCAEDASPDRHQEDATIVLTLKMPHAPATRAITPTPGEENKIDVVNVLALIQKGSDWVYDYTATVTQKTVSGNTLTVTARAREMSVPQQFVILANCSAELATPGLIIRGKKIEDIENDLVCSTGGGEWPARLNGSGSFIPFPMYARTGSETVNSGANSIGISPTIHMIRMVARIDVTVLGSIPLTTFKLKDACLFNYKTGGYISYARSGFSGTAVTIPAVPASGNHAGNPPKQPTAFYEADYTYNTKGEILSSIYTFESPAITSESGKTTGTALVISGFYNGSSTESYYRIDLKTVGEPNSSYISSGILRNHRYAVEVQSVTGPGYPNALDAYLGGNQVTALVTKWNEALQDVIADQQFYLRTEQDGDGKFWNNKTETTLTVKAETDYNITSQGFPAGIYLGTWECTPPLALGEWLTFTSVGSNGDLTREFKFVVDRTKAPTGVTEATVRIPVTAGNLTKNIYVKLIIEYYPEAHSGWAGSNIYWDGSKLTFDNVGVTTNKRVQGVYFQWGSLTGISPVGKYSTTNPTLYLPGGGTSSGTAWNSIPRVGDSVISGSGTEEEQKGRGYLYEITDEIAGIGDICKHLTDKGWAPAGKWRMPTAKEFEPTSAYTKYGSGNIEVTSSDPAGKQIFDYGISKADIGNPDFPTAGFRGLDGDLSSVGRRSAYWSSTYKPNSGTGGYLISYYVGYDIGVIDNERRVAASVRCVRE